MRRLKNCVFFLVALLGLNGAAYASAGDVAGDVLETDIVTEFGGAAIPSFAIGGETLIAAEDLGAYGYHVYYDDQIRCLFVTFGEEPVVPLPVQTVPETDIGTVVGHYYESDIRVFINGVPVEGYALDGKMAVCVEDLGAAQEAGGVSPYGMQYCYDDVQRKLSFWNAFDKLPPKKEQKQAWVAERENDILSSDYDSWEGDGFELVRYSVHGTPHGTYDYYGLFWDNGLSIDLFEVLDAYGLRDTWGRVLVLPDTMELSGTQMFFSAADSLNDTTMNTRYVMDLKTLAVRKAE